MPACAAADDPPENTANTPPMIAVATCTTPLLYILHAVGLVSGIVSRNEAID